MRRALVVLVALGVLVVAAPAAGAKSFRVAAVQIQAELRPDASMRVVEHITYDFDGSFSEGLRPIPPGPYEIVDMSVAENGTALPTAGEPHNLSFRFNAVNERRTFSISYTVLRAASVGPDVAELYWKWVGDQHPGVGVVRVQLDVPGEGGVRAWAHGPLHGAVEIQGTTVLFSVDELPPGEFVEGRVAVPASAFSVAPSGAPRLDAIVAEETVLAQAANEARERQERIRQVMRTLYPLVPVLGWVIFLALWLRWGREHKTALDTPEYLRELPDDPPAFVDALLRFGTVRPVALSSTIVDLAQRGHLTIEEEVDERGILPDKVDYRLRWQPTDDLVSGYERTLLDRLFARGHETTQAEFLAWAKNHQTDAYRWWQRFLGEVQQAFKARRYVEGGKGAAFGLNVLAAGGVVAASVGVLSTGELLGIAGLLSGVAQLLVTSLLRRRTPAGAQRAEEWEAVKRFLEDFSQLDEAPIGHLILWERYLVYAVALGVADEVAEALAARIPEPAGPRGSTVIAPWYRGSRGVGSFGRFAGGFGPAVVAAAQPKSSSSSGSGFGGGFSGGGGGGGGGGGIGAR